jgi:hypothetical protein
VSALLLGIKIAIHALGIRSEVEGDRGHLVRGRETIEYLMHGEQVGPE